LGVSPISTEALSRADEAASRGATVDINPVDLQWVDTVTQGWAAPLKGFMNEMQYLQCLHYEHFLDDGKLTSMSVPIVLPVTAEDKNRLKDQSDVVLRCEGKNVALVRSPSFFEHRKEERAGMTFGITHPEHPYIQMINSGGDFCMGGAIEELEDIKYGDGLDHYRLSPAQLRERFKDLDADAVFAFQLRNPVHNGHALLMQDTARRLKEQGYRKPVLWLSPLGGWTKDDDVALADRIMQHEAIIKNGVFGDTEVVMSIFPSPMLYAGPREVQWHAKARLNAGATHYIVGRDPAGMKHPGTNEDLYEMWHGQTMLELAPELSQGLQLLPFKLASYDQTTKRMAFFDPARKDDFLSISGTKMRKMAREGVSPPEGFMDPAGWDVLVNYYQKIAKEEAAQSA